MVGNRPESESRRTRDVAFVVIGAALRVRTEAPRSDLTATIYPSWMWGLVVVGLAAGVTSIVAAARPGSGRHAAPGDAAGWVEDQANDLVDQGGELLNSAADTVSDWGSSLGGTFG
jgi:hypothetical protein